MGKEAIKNYFAQDYLPFYRAYLKGFQKPRGNQVKALCRFHDDDNASLDINIKDGRFNCHGCPAQGDIFDFYGKVKGLDAHNGGFPDILRGIAEDFNISVTKQEKRLVATYNYTDVSGALLYQVIRYEPKEFKQRRPNGKGGFIYNLEGTKRVLYNLPGLTGAQEVMICEGEKDVDNVRGLGFQATCNSEGAGKWKDEFSDCLKGKDIILIPDNDGRGRNHMNDVAVSLQGKAKSIKWIDLPGLSEKGDVTDFINTFGDDKDGAAKRLYIMIENAPEYEPKEPDSIIQETPLKELSLSDDEELEFAEARPLIPEEYYIADCIKVSEPKPCWNTRKIFLTFRIVESPYQGIELFRAFDIGYGPIKPGRKFYKYWKYVHGKEPSRNAKKSPKVFLNKRYRIEVKTVIQKVRSKVLPGGYSKVDHFELLNYPDIKND